MEAHPNKSGQKPYITTDSMIELYKQGKSSEQIAKLLGLCKSSVSRRLSKSGVQLRTSADYSGENRYWRWKGDNYLSDVTRKRNQSLHRRWSRAVMCRDKDTCQDCGAIGVRLHAHHLISLTECVNTSLEYNVLNGVTLCVPCHGARHKILREQNRKSTL